MNKIINLLTLFVYISLLITNIWTYNHHKIDDIDVDSDQDDDQGVNDLFNPLNKKELEELLEELFENNGKKDTDRLIPSQYREEKSCYEKMSVQDNRILHTKESIANGAQFLDVKFIERNEKNELILHEKCMEQCCSSETNGACDTALLSLKAGHDGYRCYLFNCSNKCMFVKHDDFAVMRMKDKIQPEPIPTQPQPPSPTTTLPLPTRPVQVQTQKPPIVTENKPQQATNKPSEVISSITIDGTGQSGKDDKTRADDFMSGTSIAIVLLVIGISLTIGMFIYFMVNAGYVNRKFKSRTKRDKNASADAEADYLINGMYL